MNVLAALLALSAAVGADPANVPLTCAARTTVPPMIDHRLDDAAWQTAQFVGPFWPVNLRRPARHETLVRVAWNDEALFLAADCADKRPDEIVSLTKDRDGEVYRDSAIEIFLQPTDTSEYYHLVVNSAGTRFDEIGRSNPADWNPDWMASAGVTTAGWCVELRIPFASLGVPVPKPGDVWRMNLCRVGSSDGEMVSWSPVRRDFHDCERFGEVQFVDQTPASLRLAWTSEAMPIVGSVEPWKDGYTLWLDAFPEGGSAVRRQVPMMDGRFVVEAGLFEDGRGMMTLSLHDDAGNAVCRTAVPYEVLASRLPQLAVQSKQPYYTNEADIEARVTTNDPDAARLLAELRRDGKVVVEQSLPVTEHEQLVWFAASVLPEGDYQLVFTLLNKEAQTLVTETRTIHRLSPQVTPSRVEIRENGICFVNDKPFFPVIFYLTNGNETVARAANTVVGGGEDPQRCADFLDTAHACGLMGMPHLCDLLRGHDDWEGLRATVSRNKNHPALLSWYLGDEPEGSGDLPDTIRKAREIIREIDPVHPIAVLNNTPPVFAAYAACADVHMTDPYPIPHSPLALVSEWTDVSRNAAGPTKPTWMCLQTQSLALYGVPDGRWPSADELHCMMYLALTHGAKGIAWWCFSHAREGGQWAAYESIYHDIGELAPYLLSDDKVPGLSIVADNPQIHVSIHPRGSRCLILVANPGDRLDARLTLSGIHATKTTPLFGGDPVPVTDGTIALSVPALGRVALVLE